MAWNESGNGNENKPKDPWRHDDGNGQPPDLDKLMLDLQRKLKGMMGGKGGGTGNIPPQGGQGMPNFNFRWVLIALFVIYVLSGIYIVKPAEQAVVLQFGKYVTEVGPGPHWLPPIIRSKRVLNVEEIHDIKHRNRMLTGDENIVSIDVKVQYRVGNIKDYLFNLVDPVYSLQEATDSAIRQVVGASTLDEILTTERGRVRDEIRQQLEETLALYQAGILVTDVAMEAARPPEEVQEAFDDAIKASEDEDRMINQAKAYREHVIPIARGNAERVLADARAYAQEIQLKADADATRFSAILSEYKKAPTVTRRRMYLDTLQNVYGQTSKIIVDSKGGNNVFYLPLDQLAKASGNAQKPENVLNIPTQPPMQASSTKSRASTTTDTYRSRERDRR